MGSSQFEPQQHDSAGPDANIKKHLGNIFPQLVLYFYYLY